MRPIQDVGTTQFLPRIDAPRKPPAPAPAPKPPVRKPPMATALPKPPPPPRQMPRPPVRPPAPVESTQIIPVIRPEPARAADRPGPVRRRRDDRVHPASRRGLRRGLRRPLRRPGRIARRTAQATVQACQAVADRRWRAGRRDRRRCGRRAERRRPSRPRSACVRPPRRDPGAALARRVHGAGAHSRQFRSDAQQLRRARRAGRHGGQRGTRVRSTGPCWTRPAARCCSTRPAEVPSTPASTNKLLTSAAALLSLEPADDAGDHRRRRQQPGHDRAGRRR